MGFDAALTAWATLGLGALAVVTAVFALLAWKAQGQQLRTLQGQLTEQTKLGQKQLPVLEGQLTELEASRQRREREAQERHEQFVTQVFCWHEVGPDHGVLQAQIAAGAKPSMVSRTFLRNTGPTPVYDIAFGWWVGKGLYYWSSRATPLMPATQAAPAEATESWAWTIPADVDPETITITVFIRDAAGNRWRLSPGGHYDEFRDDMLPPGATWATS